MKFIKKSEKEPDALSEWKDLINEDWQPTTWEDLQNPHKEKIHIGLLKEQGYICCYCQKRIYLTDSHIEHFKPKDKNLYPDLMFDYYNFLASCPKDSPKGGYKHCGPFKGNWYDEKLTVSPFNPNCVDYFLYTEAGEILPSEDQDKYESAKITIEKLGLDFIELKNERKSAIDGILYEDIDGVLCEVELSREDIEKLVLSLDKTNEIGQHDPFCSVLIHILKQYL